jgi:hypothetical protein
VGLIKKREPRRIGALESRCCLDQIKTKRATKRRRKSGDEK